MENDELLYKEQLDRVRQWLDQIPNVTPKTAAPTPRSWFSLRNNTSSSTLSWGNLEESEEELLFEDLQDQHRPAGVFSCFRGFFPGKNPR